MFRERGLASTLLALVLAAAASRASYIPEQPVCGGVFEGLRRECQVLHEIFDATGGPQGKWINSSGWAGVSATGRCVDCCEWFGVTCGADGRVRELELWHNGLEGQLPATIGELSALQGLYLHGNRLSGPIPPALGLLSQVRELDLAMNNLSGPLPPSLQLLGRRLRRVSLFSNHLTGRLEAWWGRMYVLQSLSLSNNPRLSGPIPDVFHNSQLQELDLMNSGFNGTVPASLLSRPKGFRLYLSGNNLTALPSLNPSLSTPPFLSLHNNSTAASPRTKDSSSKGACFLDQNPFHCPLPLWASNDCGATCGPRIAVLAQ